MFFDSYYLLLVVPTLILSIFAQILVKSTFSKYSNISSKRNMSGAETANLILRVSGISDVAIQGIQGNLTDHYDPSLKTLRLSTPVHSKNSIAAIGVAAHECGHAIQHATNYGPLALRSYLVPSANFGASLGPYLAIAGLFFNLPLLLNAGIILFSLAVVFYLVTLPVEFNASTRAIAILKKNAVLTDQELIGVKKVLTAAALTYVASALTAVASLFRLILLSKNRRE